ncbi:hypothetical protein Cob_v001800 [Colletotrichum orbiculare MAFF 240422]|uniref:Uncharacterized protein n=1 Tax=Colletotrichum orbiculare (strain 104-T / ATCC 96160 / CBS 514.97 / LARS 414 / MAFF 240422) TaxID=1213857 RepID=N4VCQ2_COLOR|nr:hypothetical protein Cob_v001800 [Colletotrichum orbiculare MAFF 240422]
MALLGQAVAILLCFVISLSRQSPIQAAPQDGEARRTRAAGSDLRGLLPRARKPVPSLSDLGCDVTATGNGDWMEVGHGDDFVMQARVDDDTETLYRKYADHTDPKNRRVKAREVTVAFWKDYSKYAVKHLRHIVYTDMANKDTLRATAYVKKTWDPDCSGGWCRVSWSNKEAFAYLISKSPHAAGSNAIPNEFEEFSKHYVSSFDWSDSDDDMDEDWFRANFLVYE